MLYAFLFEHKGVWLPGFSMIMERNEGLARSALATLLHSSGLRNCTIEQAREIAAKATVKWTMYNPISTIIWNGDY
jgi:hypothetical protein